MDSLFLNANLFWFGAPLLAAPIVIHLINLMRHRRVQWAAMEFVLASHKKSNTWIILKQLLLLLLRILAIAAVILILAQLLLKDQWKFLVGGVTTHHVILLDDSFSTSDKTSDSSAFDRAKQAIERIGEQAVNARSRQKITLVRFSRAAKPDINEALVDRDFGVKLASTLKRINPSQTDTGPGSALTSLFETLDEPKDEKRIVYIVSDFRAREWASPEDIDEHLKRLEEEETDVRLVQCVKEAHNNLAITELKPRPGVIAAGVPLFLEVAVRNYGKQSRHNVSVLLLEDELTRPSVVIDEIRPGRTETRRFQVSFTTAGQHRVQASLEADVVEADNVRNLVLDLPTQAPVLICDGDPDASDGRFLNYVFYPNEQANTGLRPQIELPRFLSNNPLDKFQSIYLANFATLDQAAVENLEAYVAAGGGLAIFAGEQFNSKFINTSLYRDGEGVFPAPLAAQFDLIVDRLEPAPDLEPETDHPVFNIFAFRRNDFLEKVNVYRYFALQKGWAPKPDSTTKIIARLRNGAPLAIEQRFGKGRVVAFLTTAAPVWNNWAGNPSFVVAMHQLQSHLTSARWQDESRVVHTPIQMRLDPTRYSEKFKFITPNGDDLGGQAARTEDVLEINLPDTNQSGVYRLELARRDGEPEVRTYAFNVVPEEGDLAVVGADALQKSLTAPVTILPAESVRGASDDQAQSSVSEFLLYALIFVLIGEQVLAYSVSYHPKSLKGAA